MCCMQLGTMHFVNREGDSGARLKNYKNIILGKMSVMLVIHLDRNYLYNRLIQFTPYNL